MICGLRLTAYGLRLRLGASGEMLERLWVLTLNHWRLFSMKPFEKNGDQRLEAFLKGQHI